jgi:hypothetical protein
MYLLRPTPRFANLSMGGTTAGGRLSILHARSA